MKKVKLLLWLVVLGLLALGIYQNLPLLKKQVELKLNLWVFGPFQAEVLFGLLLLGLFIAGLLIAYFFSLAHRFKTRKTIRRLNESLHAEQKKVSELESRLGHQVMSSATETGATGPAAAVSGTESAAAAGTSSGGPEAPPASSAGQGGEPGEKKKDAHPNEKPDEKPDGKQ